VLETALAVGAMLVALLSLPTVTYLLLWWVRWMDQPATGGRPEPPSPNRTRRTIPGGNPK